MTPKGISTNSGPILRICEKFEKKIKFSFRHESQSKQCETRIFIFRINQMYSTMFLHLKYTLFATRGISSYSRPILRICGISKIL